MSNRVQNIIIGLIAFTMLFSSLGTGLLLLAQDDDPAESIFSNPEAIEVQDEATATTENNEEVAAQSEVPDDVVLPEAFIPDGAVTELGIEDLVEGSSEAVVEPASTITVNYHGTLASDGSEFDSSYRRGQPASFPLTGVIQGWQEGLVGMKEGGKRRLVIPADLAYGPAERPGIPANSALVFEVELISIDQ